MTTERGAEEINRLVDDHTGFDRAQRMNVLCQRASIACAIAATALPLAGYVNAGLVGIVVTLGLWMLARFYQRRRNAAYEKGQNILKTAIGVKTGEVALFRRK